MPDPPRRQASCLRRLPGRFPLRNGPDSVTLTWTDNDTIDLTYFSPKPKVKLVFIFLFFKTAFYAPPLRSRSESISRKLSVYIADVCTVIIMVEQRWKKTSSKPIGATGGIHLVARGHLLLKKSWDPTFLCIGRCGLSCHTS